MGICEIPEKELLQNLPIAINCLAITIPFVVNRNVPGFFECLFLSFVSLLFCGPEDSSLCPIFRQQSYQGFFKFRPVSTILKSYSQGEEIL